MPSPLRLIADQAFSRAAGASLVEGNRVKLLCDAEENYPAWLEAINAAERWVHFETYILRDDTSGREFGAALSAAAKRGVKVRLIYDWLGALSATPWMFWERLRRAGVDVRAFNQPRLDSPLGWMARDHRKMLSVDGRVGFVTGLCVADMWWGRERYKGLDPWRDTGVAIWGPAVADIEQAFAEVWAATGRALPDEEVPADGTIAPAGTTALRVIGTKPSTAGLFRLDQLVAAVARERLWITDAYFVGASPYIQALIAAAADGVDVRHAGAGQRIRSADRAAAHAGGISHAPRSRRPHLRVERHHGPRQDRGGRRPMGAGRLEQLEHSELAGQLGARRRGRRRAFRAVRWKTCSCAISTTRPRSC